MCVQEWEYVYNVLLWWLQKWGIFLEKKLHRKENEEADEEKFICEEKFIPNEYTVIHHILMFIIALSEIKYSSWKWNT